MESWSAAWLYLLASLGVLVTMYMRRGSQNLFLYVGAFFFLFAFGPVINYLVGNQVYVGVVTAQIERVSLGFLLALVGILVVDAAFSQQQLFDMRRVESDTRVYPLIAPLLILLSAYAALAVIAVAPVLDGTKQARIEAAGPGHRWYLFMEICAVSLYFLTRGSRFLLWAYGTNLFAYVVYCLATAERDFLFAIFAVALIRQLVRGVVRISRNLLIAGACVAAAAQIVAFRAGRNVTVPEVLNQGSLLFVDTFVYGLVPERLEYMNGGTYVNSVQNLLPSALYQTDFNLADWLLRLYAPTSESGYGFSMSAEAYVNFGLLGIPLVFAMVAGVYRYVVNRIDKSHFYGYFAILYTFVWMYAIRADSLMLFKACLYGVLLFVVLHVTSYYPPRLQSAKSQRSSRGQTRLPSSTHRR